MLVESQLFQKEQNLYKIRKCPYRLELMANLVLADFSCDIIF